MTNICLCIDLGQYSVSLVHLSRRLDPGLFIAERCATMTLACYRRPPTGLELWWSVEYCRASVGVRFRAVISSLLLYWSVVVNKAPFFLHAVCSATGWNIVFRLLLLLDGVDITKICLLPIYGAVFTVSKLPTRYARRRTALWYFVVMINIDRWCQGASSCLGCSRWYEHRYLVNNCSRIQFHHVLAALMLLLLAVLLWLDACWRTTV